MEKYPCPENYLDYCLRKPVPSTPIYRGERFIYSDGVRVLFKENGEIVTLFPDGSKHREYGIGGLPNYEEPKTRE